VTSDQTEALIETGTEIPYQQARAAVQRMCPSESDVEFGSQAADHPDDNVIMDIKVNKVWWGNCMRAFRVIDPPAGAGDSEVM